MQVKEQVRSVADHVITVALARASMVLALPLISLLFWSYEGKRNAELQDIKDEVVRVEKLAVEARAKAVEVSDRLIIVETRQHRDAADGEKFQRETLSRLDRMQDALIQLSNSVAALNATVKSLAERQR